MSLLCCYLSQVIRGKVENGMAAASHLFRCVSSNILRDETKNPPPTYTTPLDSKNRHHLLNVFFAAPETSFSGTCVTIKSSRRPPTRHEVMKLIKISRLKATTTTFSACLPMYIKNRQGTAKNPEPNGLRLSCARNSLGMFVVDAFVLY